MADGYARTLIGQKEEILKAVGTLIEWARKGEAEKVLEALTEMDLRPQYKVF